MTKSIGEVCRIIGGGTPSKKNPHYYEGSIPWASVRDMNVRVIKTTEYSITEEALRKSATNLIPAGEVVISTHVGLGKVCVLGQDTAINQDLKAVIPSDDSLSRWYLYYWFLSKADILVANGKGATVKGVTVDFVKGLKLPIRERHEQDQIVKILDAIHLVIESSELELCKLDQLVKSRFVEMFGDLNVNPKRWLTDMLGRVCDVRDGTHASPVYCDVGYPLMTSKNFANGYEDFSGVKLISEEEFLEINKRSKVDVGDIVMPMIGTIGHPVIARVERAYAIKNVALIKFREASPCNVYVKTVLESSYFERAVAGTSRGNTQKFIALGDIRSFVLPLPPLALQREFAVFVAEVDKSEFALRRSLDACQKLYLQQLQEAFG